MYSRFKQVSPFAASGNHLVKVLVNRLIFRDTLFRKIANTSSTVMISYYFMPDNEKGRDELYKQIKKLFSKSYPQTSDHTNFNTDSPYESRTFWRETFNNYAEMIIYKGRQ